MGTLGIIDNNWVFADRQERRKFEPRFQLGFEETAIQSWAEIAFQAHKERHAECLSTSRHAY